jgi:hypothetical protein
MRGRMGEGGVGRRLGLGMFHDSLGVVVGFLRLVFLSFGSYLEATFRRMGRFYV